ncbi:MAG: M23 family metallopeptidase [Pseudobdellovibrionaceae bacterium]
MMRFFLSLFLFAVLAGCSTSSKQPIHADQPAPPSSGNSEEDKVLSQWQDERSRGFFEWPVDDARMTRGFLPNRRKPHLGLDLAAPKGTKIYAAHEGQVIYAGRDFRGFGKMVLIEGAGGWATLYAHFSSIQVKEGQKVSQGQQIGLMGRTGRASGVHLHFEIRKAKGPVDPLLYLPGGTRLASQKN